MGDVKAIGQVTEGVAHAMACPSPNAGIWTYNRGSVLPPVFACRGSLCMAWRWAAGTTQRAIDDGNARGRCCLGGSVSR